MYTSNLKKLYYEKKSFPLYCGTSRTYQARIKLHPASADAQSLHWHPDDPRKLPDLADFASSVHQGGPQDDNIETGLSAQKGTISLL